MTHFEMILLVSASALIAASLSAGLAHLATRNRVLDVPKFRSSHRCPTPRGAGIAVLLGSIPLALLGAPAEISQPVAAALWLSLPLAVLSLLDDLRHVAIRWRLATQLACSLPVIAAFGEDFVFFRAPTPMILDRAMALFALVWFTNLFNFMDGIDGMAGAGGVVICTGVAAVAAIASSSEDTLVALVLAGALAGFLTQNWYPAKIFLGDVGSIPVGFLIGVLLLHLSALGHTEAAIILPAYFVADTTLTLLWRAVSGRRIWEAHREHFYQRAAAMVGRHDIVSRRALVVQTGAVCLALLSTVTHSVIAKIAIGVGALIITVSLLLHFNSLARAAPRRPHCTRTSEP